MQTLTILKATGPTVPCPNILSYLDYSLIEEMKKKKQARNYVNWTSKDGTFCRGLKETLLLTQLSVFCSLSMNKTIPFNFEKDWGREKREREKSLHSYHNPLQSIVGFLRNASLWRLRKLRQVTGKKLAPKERSQHQVQQRAAADLHNNIVWEPRGPTDKGVWARPPPPTLPPKKPQHFPMPHTIASLL